MDIKLKTEINYFNNKAKTACFMFYHQKIAALIFL